MHFYFLKSPFSNQKNQKRLFNRLLSFFNIVLPIVVSYHSVQRTEVGFTSFLFDGFTIALLDEKIVDTIFVQCSNFSISF